MWLEKKMPSHSTKFSDQNTLNVIKDKLELGGMEGEIKMIPLTFPNSSRVLNLRLEVN
jgi:hypothetical protein